MPRSYQQGYGIITANINVLQVDDIYENVTVQKHPYDFLILITLVKHEHRQNPAMSTHDSTLRRQRNMRTIIFNLNILQNICVFRVFGTTMSYIQLCCEMPQSPVKVPAGQSNPFSKRCRLQQTSRKHFSHTRSWVFQFQR